MINLMLNNKKCTYFDKYSGEYFLKTYGILFPDPHQVFRLEQGFEFKRYIRNLLTEWKSSGKFEDPENYTLIGGKFKCPPTEVISHSPLYEMADRNLMIDEIQRFHRSEGKPCDDKSDSYITDIRNPASFNFTDRQIRIPKIGTVPCRWGFEPGENLQPYYLQIYKSDKGTYHFNAFFKMFPSKKTVSFFRQLLGIKSPVKTELKTETFLGTLPTQIRQKTKVPARYKTQADLNIEDLDSYYKSVIID